MTEYKVGDRVLYKGFEGTIINQKGKLYEVRFDNAGFYLYADQMEPLKEAKGCQYCKHGEPLNDTSNSNFSLTIDYDENYYFIRSEWDDGMEWSEDEYSIINYCPKCGRKLEVAE